MRAAHPLMGDDLEMHRAAVASMPAAATTRLCNGVRRGSSTLSIQFHPQARRSGEPPFLTSRPRRKADVGAQIAEIAAQAGSGGARCMHGIDTDNAQR